MHSFLHIYALVLNSPVRTIRTLRSCNSCSKFIYELWSAVTPCRPNSCCFASNSLQCVMKLKQNRNTQHTPLDYIYIGRPTTKKKNGKSHHTYFILMFALFFFILCCAVWCGFVCFDPRVCAVCTSECSSQVARCSLIESEKIKWLPQSCCLTRQSRQVMPKGDEVVRRRKKREWCRQHLSNALSTSHGGDDVCSTWSRALEPKYSSAHGACICNAII